MQKGRGADRGLSFPGRPVVSGGRRPWHVTLRAEPAVAMRPRPGLRIPRDAPAVI